MITKQYRIRGPGYVDEYTIHIEWQGQHYVLSCSNSPYNPRRSKYAEHHLMKSGRICIREGHEPKTLDRALALIALWMEGYSAYCRSGSFPTETKRYNV